MAHVIISLGGQLHEVDTTFVLNEVSVTDYDAIDETARIVTLNGTYQIGVDRPLGNLKGTIVAALYDALRTRLYETALDRRSFVIPLREQIDVYNLISSIPGGDAKVKRNW